MSPLGDLQHRFKWLLRVTVYIWLNVVLALLGLGLSMYGTGWLNGVGTSLLASAVVGLLFLYQLRIDRQFDQARQLYDEYGLVGVTGARSDKALYEDLMRRCRHSFDIMGHSLSRMYDDLGRSLLPEMSVRGVKIRILLLHPASEFVKAREVEDSSPERVDLAAEIRKAAAAYKALALTNLTIKYYRCTPTLTYQRLDNVIFAGPYFVGLPSGRQSALCLRADHELASQYQEHFERIWSDFSEDVDGV